MAFPRVLVIGGRRAADSMESHVMDALAVMESPAALCTVGMDLEGAFGNWGRVVDAAWGRFSGVCLREPERLSEKRLTRRAREFDPDLVLIIQGNRLSPKTVAQLRRCTRSPIVCWCQDQLATLGRQYMLGAGYDAVFLKDRYMVDLFSRMIRSTTFRYLPEACNPRVHRPIELSPRDQAIFGCEVMVYGSLYYYRQEILRQLQEFDLKVWGNAPAWMINDLGPRYAGGEVVLEKKARAVRAARVALNTLHYAEIDGLNCRTFELAGCGAFQLVSQRPVLQEHFRPGEELDSFSCVEELCEKIRHYLANPEKAVQIACRGQRRAHAEHTYEQRLSEIFRVVLPTARHNVPGRRAESAALPTVSP